MELAISRHYRRVVQCERSWVVVHERIHVRQVAQLENMVPGLRVTSFVTVDAAQDWDSDLRDTKMHTTAIEVQKESAVEGRHGGSKLPVVFVLGMIALGRPHLDEVGENALLLLPEIFGAHPGEHQIETVGRVTL